MAVVRVLLASTCLLARLATALQESPDTGCVSQPTKSAVNEELLGMGVSLLQKALRAGKNSTLSHHDIISHPVVQENAESITDGEAEGDLEAPGRNISSVEGNETSASSNLSGALESSWPVFTPFYCAHHHQWCVFHPAYCQGHPMFCSLHPQCCWGWHGWR
eukprot:TRINITY_DN8166_c0_g2_i1.p1 TRINITY_DN8166_c0_g2~~TRINITY_DN8166_c0_g2_i1.p1  ORF type:complete len:162 (+),score=13.17 TRINITY_DN8166_c0_g2_i1:71-556(+)